MKVAPNIILLFKDKDGIGEVISTSLQPNPNPNPNPKSTLTRIEESYQLSLDNYGSINTNARADFHHFVDDSGVYQVSVLLMESYEPPILACSLNEVLAQILSGTSGNIPTFVVPFLASSSKLKWEKNIAGIDNSKNSIYGLQIGKDTETISSIIAKTQRPPALLQIHYEPLACFIQFVRVLKIPTLLLIGWEGQNSSANELREEETVSELGQFLASSFSLCFSKDKFTWKPAKKSRDDQAPWRSLYG